MASGSYAGAPLRARGGQAIGSLCIMDTKPRTMSERELRLLQLTAEEVMEELNARTPPAENSTSELAVAGNG